MDNKTILQESYKITDFGLFSSFLSRSTIVDYGVVEAVNGARVDVKNLVYPGESPVTTKDVELLFPSSAGLSIQYEVKVGDTLLLLGSRRYIKSLANQTSPKKEVSGFGYDKGCVKAIPLSFVSGKSDFTIIENNSKLKMSNAAQSLATLIDNLITQIENIQTVGSPGNHVLSPTSITAFQNIATQFKQLLY